MNDRPRPEHRPAGSVRVLVHWSAYVGLVLAAGGLMMLGKADSVLVERFRSNVAGSVAPVLDVLSHPVASTTHAIQDVQSWLNLHEENVRLKDEHERLMHWQSVARHLEAENEALKRLLNFVPEAEARYISARVIADSVGAFAHSVLINAGSNEGIEKGQAVTTGDGLVGRIAGVSSHASRVLLITDLNSRIPVVVGSGRVRAMLVGDNTSHPKLVYLTRQGAVSSGDRVVTSGHAGVFAPGLPIGTVAAIEQSKISVKPLVERDRLEYVRVMDFGTDGILDQTMTKEAL